jgi:hypothetical protein
MNNPVKKYNSFMVKAINKASEEGHKILKISVVEAGFRKMFYPTSMRLEAKTPYGQISIHVNSKGATITEIKEEN